jgi:hypothetical protein
MHGNTDLAATDPNLTGVSFGDQSGNAATSRSVYTGKLHVSQ